jgi:hypothetical protein
MYIMTVDVLNNRSFIFRNVAFTTSDPFVTDNQAVLKY